MGVRHLRPPHQPQELVPRRHHFRASGQVPGEPRGPGPGQDPDPSCSQAWRVAGVWPLPPLGATSRLLEKPEAVGCPC